MKKNSLFKVLPLLAVALVGVAMATSCKKEKCMYCGFEEPLRDCEWLDKKVKELKQNSVTGANISYCNYRLKNEKKVKEGFLIIYGDRIEPVQGDELYKCSGDIEHFFGGFVWYSDTNYIIVSQKILFKNI